MSMITSKAARRLYTLVLLKQAGVPQKDILEMYMSRIRPVIEYGCEAWHPGLTQYLERDIESIQKCAFNIIYKGVDYSEALEMSGIPSLKERRQNMCKKFFENMKDETHKLHHLVPKEKSYNHNIRKKISVPPKAA